jgi:hypothetical protein
MEYAVEMDSGAMIYEYIPSFVDTGPGIQKLIGELHRKTDSTVMS